MVFGERLDLAVQYVDHLADTGVAHGLIGPREVPRLWDRHLVNCALLTELLPAGAAVIDVGAGAGLPGIVVAIRRPDVSVTLVEPLLRRVRWLEGVLADLGLNRIEVRRGRAEELAGALIAPYVTARAVASIDKLVRWSAPLLAPDGEILAIKGRTAPDELAQHQRLLAGWGVTGEIIRLGSDVVDEPTVVARLKVPDPTLVVTAGLRARIGSSRSEPDRRARRRR